MARPKIKRKGIDLKELLMSDEKDLLKSAVQEMVQEILEAEMDDAVGARKGERSSGRMGYRSGYYSRSLVTRVGKLELRVPQDRQGRFSTEIFERYQRSEKALVACLAEMYVQGVSTRKVKAITEELCGHEFSASAVSDSVTGRRSNGITAAGSPSRLNGVAGIIAWDEPFAMDGAEGHLDFDPIEAAFWKAATPTPQ